MALCDHCLLEIPPGVAIADGDGRRFCCEGCAAVAAFIRGEGLGAFYRRRDWKAGEGERASPAATADPEPFLALAREREGAMEVEFFVEGVRCASCVWLLERVLEKTRGVSSARVSYVTHQARVRWDPAATGLPEILRRVGATGHVPRAYGPSAAALARRAESRDLLVRFGTAAFLSAQLMVYSMALYAGYFEGIDAGTKRLFGVISLLLATPVVAWAGGPIFRGAAAGLGRLAFTMDSLVALGAGSAFAASVWNLARGGEVYFDTAAMIVTLVLLGRTLEARARARAGESIERLAELAPRHAVRLRPGADGTEVRETVAIDALRPGDLVEVLPGGKFPADGAVLRGESAADESLLTGESRPVPKAPGDPVAAGALNGCGCLVLEVRRTGAGTTLARILAAVEEAQASRPPIQGIADRVVGRVVPVILAAAAVTALAHLGAGRGAERALLAAVSVVVIACPCSIGLATPLALLHYLARASSRGVLVRGGETAERAAAVTVAVLDKTGTVTEGKIALREVRVVDPGLDPGRCLDVAAALEAQSEHALGAALAGPAGRPLPGVEEFAAHPGRGVSGRVDGLRVLLGSRAWLEENGVDTLGEGLEPGDGEALSAVHLAWEGRVRALFLLADAVREEAAEAVRALRAAGIRVLLVSGDGPRVTAAVAGAAGMDEWEAEARPGRKRELVAALQAAGEKVLVAGDGINDAPALAEASVGVAVARGIDAARESAGVVLMRGDLRLVPWFLGLSRGTFRIVRQNFFWAFFYNAAALPIAAAGLLHPIVAAAAMAASSTFVVLNSRRVSRLG